MPPRARRGSRTRIEAALEPELLDALGALCRARGIPAERWQTQPDLAAAFGTHAAVNVARQLMAEGYTMVRAREIASIRLGLEPATIHARLARARQYAIQPTDIA